MADHFMITSWARDSVIAGMIDPLREPLSTLADYRYDELPAGSWVAGMAQLQAAARLTSQAETLDAAAMGVATMARVCGECHVANHGGPAIPPPPEKAPYVAADSVGERMGRHMWGAELLWEGLTGPSETSWNAGADTLIEAPEELDEQLPESFDTSLREVVALGQAAKEATSLAKRADVYGLLIATCADCHSRWIEHGDL
jgi:cytochrome c553